LTGNNLERGDTSGSMPNKTLGPGATPMAVDRTGSHALVQRGDKGLLLVDGLGGPLPEATRPLGSDWPSGSGSAQVVASGPRPSRPCTLVNLGQRLAVASAKSGGGVSVEHQPFPPVAWIATGPTPVASLAADPAGRALAVASGDQIGVWSLHSARPSASAVPGYDSDRVSLGDDLPAQDLLDADRDARALAALIASVYLKPPIAIGLFGAWGAGKSFSLRLIRQMLNAITESEHAEGYLNKVRVVRFSAWQYAEVNLWASLVDEVLSEIGTVTPRESSTQVKQADEAAAKAEGRAKKKARDITTAEEARRRIIRRRRLAWAVAASVGVLAAVVVAVIVLGASARLAAGYGAVLGLLTLASAAAAQIKRVAAQGRSVSEAARDISSASAWVLEQVGSGAMEEARQNVLTSRHDYELAQQEADRLRQEADRVRELSTSQQLGAVLQRMSALTEYRVSSAWWRGPETGSRRLTWR
jgi:hypothetical protein